MPNKELLSAIAIALTFVAFLPYFRSILKGATRPHVFSWIIWGITTLVVFFAQLEDYAGVGAWPIGVSALLTILIALLAYAKRADTTITKTDWLFFGSALASLPLWYFTSDPMWSVIVLTTVDALGFGPTVRKAYHAPHSESPVFFGIYMVRNLIVLLALENYSVTTALFPAAIGIACLLLIVMILVRRQRPGRIAKS